MKASGWPSPRCSDIYTQTDRHTHKHTIMHTQLQEPFVETPWAWGDGEPPTYRLAPSHPLSLPPPINFKRITTAVEGEAGDRDVRIRGGLSGAGASDANVNAQTSCGGQ